MYEHAIRALRRAPIVRPLWDQYERMLRERDVLIAERDAALAKATKGEIEFDRFILRCHEIFHSPQKDRQVVEDYGITLVPANFYSPVPLLRDLENTFEGAQEEQRPVYDKVFCNSHIRQQLEAMAPFAAEFAPPASAEHTTPPEFSWDNNAFSYTDATSYYCMVRHLRPRRIVEIGCGFSTLVADAAIRANGFGEIICIDPYPASFLSSIASVSQTISEPVQAIVVDDFKRLIEPADILFIDSTHTVKIGSDCAYIYLVLLPSITKPLMIHSHDIFLPFGMPVRWARDQHIYWNEQYLLYAYLLDNRHARVAFGSNYAAHFLPEETASLMDGKALPGGSSLWYRINSFE